MNDILQEYKLSKSCFYRVINEFKSNQSQISYKSINKDLDSISDNEIENIDDNNESINTSQELEIKINELKKNETDEEIDENKNEKSFDKQKFLKQLNNTLNSSSSEEEEKQDIVIEKEIIQPVVNKSILSNVSYTKKFNNDRSNIMDVIKNVDNLDEDIETMKKKRHLIILIKQYINNFPKELTNIYNNNKSSFDKKLYILNQHQLELILENIRIELSINRNKQNFQDCFEFSLRGV